MRQPILAFCHRFGAMALVVLSLAPMILSGSASAHPARVGLQDADAVLMVDPATVAAGGRVTITGRGFFLGEQLSLTLQATGGILRGPQLATTHATSAGTFELDNVTIPADTPAGSYLIVATGLTTGRSAAIALQVTVPSSIAVVPTTFSPNDSIDVSGEGFAANEAVSLLVTNGSIATPLGQVRADGAGHFGSTVLRVPFGVPGGAAQVVATGLSSNRQATADVTVTALAATLTVSPSCANPGTSIALSGDRFQPSETVSLSLIEAASTLPMGSLTVASDGTFSGGATIPLGAAEGAATVVATGGSSHLSAAAPISIGANPATLTLSSGVAAAGGSIGVEGSGFIPGETVTLAIRRSRSVNSPVALSTAIVGAGGTFRLDALMIPSSLNGTYMLTAYGQSSGRSASANLIVQGLPTAAPILSILDPTHVAGAPYLLSPGGLVQVAGSGFAPNTSIALALEGEDGTITLGTVDASSSGAFGPSVLTIPATIPAGRYTLQAAVGGTVAAFLPVQAVALSPVLSLDSASVTLGQIVAVTGRGYAPGEQVVLALNGAALATTPSTILASATGAFSASFAAPATLNEGANTLVGTGVTSRASVALSVSGHLPRATSYFFANGDTTSGTRTMLSLLNPTQGPATVALTFLYQAAPERHRTVRVPAHAQARLDLGALAGSNRHIATIVAADRPIAAGSTVYYPGATSASSPGASATSTSWYLAEGYTGGSFQESLAIMNPNAAYTSVDVRFLPFNGRPLKHVRFSVRPRALLTLDAASYMPRQSFGIITTSDRGVVVERTMRFGVHQRGAHAKFGVNRTSTVWLFAQGESASDRQTFLTILNPNQAAPATVTATFYEFSGSAGQVLGDRTISVAPLRRGNIKLNDLLPNARVAMVVTSNVPVVVERSLYAGPANLDQASSGSSVSGENGGGISWLFPSGDDMRAGQVQFLMFNPGRSANRVTATFFTSSGVMMERSLVVPPQSGAALDATTIPGLDRQSFGTLVRSTNGQLFVAEQRTQDLGTNLLGGDQGIAL